MTQQNSYQSSCFEKSALKSIFFVALGMLTISFQTDFAYARRHRHKKFKGVVVVNQILKLDGTMTVNGNLAPEYSGVKSGDLVETGDKSVAVIRIAGLGIFRLGPKTKFKITSFVNRDNSRFELQSGEVLCLFKRMGEHKMKLPHADLLQHGATFFVNVNDDKVETVRLDEGKLQIDNEYTLAPLPSPSPSPAAVMAVPESSMSGLATPPLAATSTGATPTFTPANAQPGPIVSPPNIVGEVKALKTIPQNPPPTEPTLTAAAEPAPVRSKKKRKTPQRASEEEKMKKAFEAPDTRQEQTIPAEGKHKLIRISDHGIEVEEIKTLSPQDEKEISDLESIYALP